MLWIDELKTISWELLLAEDDDPAAYTIRCSLEHSQAGSGWTVTRSRRSLRGSMNFASYLGTASLEVSRNNVRIGEPLRFEVITRKLEFESEYRNLVESIATHCQQLLLEWGSPTALNVANDPDTRAQILLEQFLFVRHVLGSERLDLFLETIQRHGHSKLERERRWRSTALADSRLFVRDPLRFGRDWLTTAEPTLAVAAGMAPFEIVEERKFASFDTPPNRFVKFALQQFHAICEAVIALLDAEQGAAWLEAVQMRDTLDAFLRTGFFDEVGELQRLPLESQTLQKREGYRDILHAWLMLDAAAQIDWPGRNDAYDGTNRDVATLYEYWLYFVLVRAFREKLGMQPVADPLARDEDDALPFCCTADDGRLQIHLKQGTTSFSCFRWATDRGELRLHFFYNRRFSRSPVEKRGTYSRPLRPDYTLVMIPADILESDWRKAEQIAEEQGKIAYLHFDAKYRVENLLQLFGAPGDEVDTEKHASKTTGTFKRADLYKMHTYNEAIRRTVGSYVLYPGDDPKNVEGENRFERYREIIPGVGAFALKPAANPSEDPAGLTHVLEFVSDILAHQLSRFTQSYRFTYWTETTVRESLAEYGANVGDFVWARKPPKDTQVLLGFVRNEAEGDLCRSSGTFFCHAVEWADCAAMIAGAPTDLRFDPFKSDLLTVYTSNTSAGWLAEVGNVRLVTAAERASETGRPLNAMNAAYYYRFQLSAFQAASPRDVSGLVSRRPGKPVAKQLSEFAQCDVI
jgi:predicted component of viral defense system (DUF524 family)